MMTTTQDIAELARAAGRADRGWGDFCCDDVVQDFVSAHADTDADIKAWEAAYHAGLAEHRAAAGWLTRWTTAPVDYDTFGTLTTEQCGNWRDRPLRRVLCHPHHAGFQTARYGSGMHPSWDVDPRIEERAAEERADRWRREDAERAIRREYSLAWLAAATNEEIEAAQDADEIESRGLTYAEVRGEIKRRETAAADAARAAEWDRCRAAFADGAILVDRGTEGFRGVYGWVAGEEPHVYYAVRVTNDWAKVADDATVQDDVGDSAGSLAVVADRIASGRIRLVRADEVPPAPVTRRLGHEKHREIRRVEVAGRVVWVGRPRFDWKFMVLDERGRLVRAKAVLEAALAAAG